MSLSGQGQDWPNAITAYAEKHEIVIKGQYGVSRDDYPGEKLPSGKLRLVRKAASADKWKFKQQYKKSSAACGHGGMKFDITKMSKNEGKASAFDKKDLLDELTSIPSED